MNDGKFDILICMRQAREKVRANWFRRPWKKLSSERNLKAVEKKAILTRQEAIEKHRIMWNRIAEILELEPKETDEIEFLKPFVIRELWGYNISYPNMGCFCCEYVSGMEEGCSHCPLEWGTVSCVSSESELYSESALYSRIASELHDNNFESAAEIAREIANLPERQQVGKEVSE